MIGLYSTYHENLTKNIIWKPPSLYFYTNLAGIVETNTTRDHVRGRSSALTSMSGIKQNLHHKFQSKLKLTTKHLQNKVKPIIKSHRTSTICVFKVFWN